MMEHVHCSICGHAAPFEVLNRRKEWEALCEEHLLWFLDNTHPRYMPEFRRRKICCNSIIREVTNPTAAARARRSEYFRARYAADREKKIAGAMRRYTENRDEILNQRATSRQSVINSLLN